MSSAGYDPEACCLPNTREALLAVADAWVRGATNSATKVVLIHGHAGSGKSALLSSITKNLDNAHIPFTYFGCKRDDADLSDIHRILPTICYDFTKYYGDYRGKISSLLQSPERRSIATGGIRTQSELLFGGSPSYDVVFPTGAHRPPVHAILIDALDECRNHHDGGKTADERRALLDFLLYFANTTAWIKVLITTRPEPDIMDTFTNTTSSVNRIDISDGRWNAPADIHVFVEAQSAKMKLGLSPDQVDCFQIRVSEHFIWCMSVFQFIQESGGNKMHLVSDILRGQLPSSKNDRHAPPYLLYQQVLNSAVSGESDRETLESVLSVIYIAATRTRSLSASAIADILYPNEECEEKRERVEKIVNTLSSILYVEEGTGVIRARHISVLDFIGGMMTGRFSTVPTNSRDNAAPRFAVGVKEVHMRMFDGCFAITNRDLRFNICELEDSSRLNKDVPNLFARISKHITESLQYAVVFWLSHLAKSDVDRKESAEKVHEFLNSRKTLFWVEALSLMNVVDRGIVILQDCVDFFVVRLVFL